MEFKKVYKTPSQGSNMHVSEAYSISKQGLIYNWPEFVKTSTTKVV